MFNQMLSDVMHHPRSILSYHTERDTCRTLLSSSSSSSFVHRSYGNVTRMEAVNGAAVVLSLLLMNPDASLLETHTSRMMNESRLMKLSVLSRQLHHTHTHTGTHTHTHSHTHTHTHTHTHGHTHTHTHTHTHSLSHTLSHTHTHETI